MAVQLSGSTLRRSYQFLGKLYPSRMTISEAFLDAATTLYIWAKKKYKTIFRMPYNIENYENRQDGWTLGILYDQDIASFVMKCTHPDSNIAGRYWITDVQLQRQGKAVYLGVRLSVSSLQSCTEPVPYSRPSFIRDISRRVGIADCSPIMDTPRLMSDNDDLEWMSELLESKERSMPIVVAAPNDDGEFGVSQNDSVDVRRLASDLFGFAHVLQLSPPMVEKWKEMVGKDWAIPSGAVRTYYPSLSFEESDSKEHPWLSAYKIKLLNNQHEEAQNYALLSIEEYVKKYHNYNQPNWDGNGICFYSVEYKRRIRLREAQAGASQQNTIDLQQKQIDVLEVEKEEYLQLATSYSNDLKETNSEMERLQRQITSIKNLTEYYRQRIVALSSRGMDEEIPENGTYEEIPDWIERYYPDRLALMPRAVRALKGACYEDVGLVYKCLKLLATDYYKFRRGEYSSHEEFMDACKKVDSGLDERQSITDVAAGMLGDEYYVNYGGERRKLDRHLTKGSNKDRRYCLRIYYFWDDDSQMVVIGHLPSHLTTSAT